MADRLLSENQVKLLEIEMYRLSEEVDMRNAEIGNLHKLFENLGNENDQLHAEVLEFLFCLFWIYVIAVLNPRAQYSHMQNVQWEDIINNDVRLS